MTRRKLLTHIFLVGVFCLAAYHSAVLADDGIHRERADIPVPESGMTMQQVEAKYGPARSTLPAVGDPPITRWQYDGFTVYFEHQRVIHSVITS